ncbi:MULTISPECIES: DnaB-like helicase N-terminal domain-containing protein [unclassified Streptomyces]|uniref:DnaB-like helicase N-terminal domain-containing protein n=1 Tax=unclassified Streptomyces TaxID=2593676 RepID=UPI002259AA77|nr:MULTISPECIES: DnaB-like helicase N-terminal domain-containing protein [unclassified Streptomyces]MCX5267415.1 AAA family ATPase [Streptomyces sp. NBC_00199]
MTDPQPNTPSRFAEGPEPTLGVAEPPYNVDAERAVLGACMHNGNVVDEVRPILGEGAFYRPAHETIWRALLAQHREDKPTDPIVLTELLQQQGDLERVGGRFYLHQLADVHYGTGSAEHHAEIIREKANLRRLLASAVRTVQRAQEPGADPEAIRSEVEAEMRAERERALASGQGRLNRFATDGWSFVKETGADAEPLWGTREKTVWAPGESLMIVGAPGVGKTTLAHQVVFARLGLQETVLEMPVAPSRRVLYLAMDRPRQIARAMDRRVFPTDEKILRERLVVWEGPLPATLDKEPDLLADLASAHRADTIVIDSLKDAVSTMVDDSLAVAFHNARMRALRGGVEIMELHHQRKATADAPRGQRPSLDQVYGSTWITAGAGSVLFITGRAGDPAVTLHHLKTPTGEIGPLDVTHDHVRGTTTVDPSKDPAVLLRNAPSGLTARDLAAILIGGGEPERADVEKARRHLARLVDSGLATKADGIAGGAGGGQQTRYYASARHLTAVG